MEEKLSRYIDSLFESAPDTQQAREMKEEIRQNTMLRYNDQIAEGRSEEAAFNIAVAGIGDVTELLRELRENNGYVNQGFYQGAEYTGYTKEEIENDKRRSGMMISIAVGMYIISLLPLYLCVASGINPIYGLCVMFAIIAAATGILIYNAKTRIHYNKKDYEDEYTGYSTEEDKSRKAIRKSICSAISTLGVVLYLIISFNTGAWHITWVIFLIVGAINNIVRTIFR